MWIPRLAEAQPGNPAGPPRSRAVCSGDAAQTEAAVVNVMTAYRRALAAGDSVRALALFSRSAWILDETERPLRRRLVRQPGCRGWCRPTGPLRQYQLRVLPDSAAALTVETYRAAGPVSSPRLRHVPNEYTVVSVLSCQDGQWRISSQTLYWQLHLRKPIRILPLGTAYICPSEFYSCVYSLSCSRFTWPFWLACPVQTRPPWTGIARGRT
ncbi:hypothetical protein GCM10027511_31660 [Hymenobacter humi]